MPQPDAKPNLPAASLAIREFVKGLRPNGPGDLSGLRALMRQGWLEHLPGIQDEYGVILVGNRRLLVTQELGIEPNIKRVTFGDGPEADAARMMLATASNVGGEGLSKEARQRTAMHLYSTGQNTLKQIAEALGVGFSTIQRDLKDFTHVGKMRPQGKGRPKGSTTRHDPVETTEPVAPQSPPPDEHDERQRRLPTAHELTDKAEQALSQGELGEVSRAAAQVFLALADMFDGKVVVNDELIALVRSQAANWHAIADEMERQRGPKTSSRIATTKPSKRKPKAPSRKVPISEQVVHLQRSLVDYVTDWIRTGEQFLNEHPQLEEKYRYALLREAAVSAERVRLWTVEQQERAQLVAPQASHTSRGN